MNAVQTQLAAAFDLAFAERCGTLECRARTSDDLAFLLNCAVACSTLVGLLPDSMLAQQAQFQRTGHDSAFPDAMHRIVMRAGAPIGHVLIAWNAADTHLVDIAVLPEHRGIGVARALLGAWLAVADAHGLPATLHVFADNPARQIYARLGFVETATDRNAASVAMRRPPAQR
ncbi:GNAT family N-acetyltransferase [Sphingomonas sp.]|uniref:GNAT family N-acetyltransferase n=1 Tax=Sphingomonas sp. TaxID=28214 RepID=UPI003BABF922